LEQEEFATMSCPGEAPELGNATFAPCWRGYWLINGSVELSATRYNIEGRIQIWGNFTLLPAASLSWKGFARENDSHPEFQTTGDFVLSHVNVTGELTVEGSIFFVVNSENLQHIFGAADPKQTKRSVSQKIVESSNPTPITLIASGGSTSDCRKLSVRTESETTSTGRASLNAVFDIDDSGCFPPKKRNKNIAVIVAPTVVVGVLLIVAIIAVLSLKSDTFKHIFRPYHKRKMAQRDSLVLRDAGSAAVSDVESGPNSHREVLEGDRSSTEQNEEFDSSPRSD
jgi:hypothetical protein